MSRDSFVRCPAADELREMSDEDLQALRHALARQERQLAHDLAEQPESSDRGRSWRIRTRDARRYTIGDIHVAKLETKRRHRATADGVVVDAAVAWSCAHRKLVDHEERCTVEPCQVCDHLTDQLDQAEHGLTKAVDAKFPGDHRFEIAS